MSESEEHEVRVRLAGFRKYKGFSDLVETYCCSATSCYYVDFPALGYATPSCAASILRDAIEGKKNYCEWIYSCYDGDPLPAVKNAIRNRHYHKGFMAEYKLALALVRKAIETGEEPLFGSWF